MKHTQKVYKDGDVCITAEVYDYLFNIRVLWEQVEDFDYKFEIVASRNESLCQPELDISENAESEYCLCLYPWSPTMDQDATLVA